MWAGRARVSRWGCVPAGFRRSGAVPLGERFFHFSEPITQLCYMQSLILAPALVTAQPAFSSLPRALVRALTVADMRRDACSSTIEYFALHVRAYLDCDHAVTLTHAVCVARRRPSPVPQPPLCFSRAAT